MPLDDRYPSPRTFLRHAARLIRVQRTLFIRRLPLTAASRGSVHAPIGELSAGLLKARQELQAGAGPDAVP